ncbi:NTP transferase domain-containing protein [Patescibacteria group bacterium]|nr:NTP transferase domain-containing protein [Patescibacteria group bacterium]
MTGNYAFITARYNSTRLPGKALLDIGGKPMLQHVVDRMRHVVPRVVVVTTQNSQPIQEYCHAHGIECFVSDYYIEEEDLIKRLVQCGDSYDAGTVLRVWGDCPFISPEIADNVLNIHNMHGNAYTYPRNLTKGLSVVAYEHPLFTKVYHTMLEQDKWHWNYIDEIKCWKDSGLRVGYPDFQMPLERCRGLNINTPADLEDARLLVTLFGEHVTYSQAIGFNWEGL